MKSIVIFLTVISLQTTLWAASETSRDSEEQIWQRVYDPGSEQVSRPQMKPVDWSQLEQADWPFEPMLNLPVFRLEKQALSNRLNSTGTEFSGQLITLPMPDGGFADFLFTESSLMAPELASRYPGIRTYSLVSIDEPGVVGHADLTPLGFHALILSPQGSFQIGPDPELEKPYYISFYEKDLPNLALPVCHAESESPLSTTASSKDLPSRLLAAGREAHSLEVSSGETLRDYEVAIATTSQYYTIGGNSDANVMASIVTVMNKVDLILRSEVAITLTLIDETDQLFFTNDGAYVSDGNACALKDENQGVVDSVLAAGDYDIGFVFDDRANTSGGCASGSVVCSDANKARGSAGLTTSPSAGHENFGGYRLVLHEMGHQFSAGHTWSGQVGNCTDDQFSQTNAYEPGGGTTLMSYSGTCGPIGADGIQLTTGDTYFHGRSFDQIVGFTTGAGDACASSSATNNDPPSVDAGADYTIPTETAYFLSGSGNDPNGDPLTFTWEQFDVAADRVPLGTDDGTGPIVRSRIPTSDPTRTIPPWTDILTGTSSAGELLTETNRTLNFRLTARDNLTVGGGVDSDPMLVTVDGDPFFITSPNGGEAIFAGCPADVTWTVGGGDVAANVDLSLSTDGGSSFQSLLLGTANDGSQNIASFSCTESSEARVMAMGSDNIFFDVSDTNFFIVENPPEVSVSATGGEVDDACTFTVTFEADITDDCSVNVADVDVQVQLVGDQNAVLGPPSINKQQINPTTIEIDGSVQVSGLTDSPAKVGIAIEALDGCGFDGDNFVIAEVVDDTPPSIDVSLDPKMLWAPKHDMRDITATVEVTDNCDVSPEVVLLSVESNEPENDIGDGNFEPDIDGTDFITADFNFRVRAERQGTKTGRIYTVTYGTADDSGNMAEDSAMIKVPHSRRKK